MTESSARHGRDHRPQRAGSAHGAADSSSRASVRSSKGVARRRCGLESFALATPLRPVESSESAAFALCPEHFGRLRLGDPLKRKALDEGSSSSRTGCHRSSSSPTIAPESVLGAVGLHSSGCFARDFETEYSVTTHFSSPSTTRAGSVERPRRAWLGRGATTS